jgi:sigma-B regulation protein RsbU (phosphoserine phosphatase)
MASIANEFTAPETHGDLLMTLRIPARADRLKHVRAGVLSAAKTCGFGRDESEDIVLAVDEACANVILHAYGEDNDGDIVLDLVKFLGGLQVRVRDFAPTIIADAIRPRKLDEIAPGGLGTHYIREIMDSAEYLPGEGGFGNVLVMTKKNGGVR